MRRSIYLSAPFQFAEKNEEWKFKTRCMANDDAIECVDPCPPDTSDANIAADCKASGNWEKLDKFGRFVIRRDLQMIHSCDGCLVFWPKLASTVGTVHEIVECWHNNIPIVLYAPEGYDHVSTWLFGLLGKNRIFDDLEEAYAALKEQFDD